MHDRLEMPFPTGNERCSAWKRLASWRRPALCLCNTGSAGAQWGDCPVEDTDALSSLSSLLQSPVEVFHWLNHVMSIWVSPWDKKQETDAGKVGPLSV